ncbi:hypothetical protein GQ55_4G065800 [Panicum hallii var. hallii]|uniref:C2H2-type domain-containing protein n=1 Tax=Panicum hallii var. hallii TaxID=1504633 RepID=A0A2T7DVW8_9POAL|nr:hypothetical protein GQ55_4G065800 [Panicum hallii var. hallii]
MLVNRKPLPPPNPKHKLERREIKPSESSEILSPETKISGVKRKADVISASTEPTELQNATSATIEPAELQNVIFAHTEPAKLQNAARHWSCALCQVSATSRANLNEHYKGRRHLAKLVHSRGIQVIYDRKSGAGPSDAPKKIRILVNGAIHEVQKSIVLTSATNEPTELQNVIPGTTEPDELQNVSSATTEPTELQNVIPGSTVPDELQNVSSATTEPTELQNVAKYWSYAVCQVVRATSKANHKKHLKGKKTSEKKGGFVWYECCSIRCRP